MTHSQIHLIFFSFFFSFLSSFFVFFSSFRSEARSQDLNRQFFQYSRLWWKEYVEIDPSFKERLVKIFAEDEWGGHRPVCSYVTPLSELCFDIHRFLKLDHIKKYLIYSQILHINMNLCFFSTIFFF